MDINHNPNYPLVFKPMGKENRMQVVLPGNTAEHEAIIRGILPDRSHVSYDVDLEAWLVARNHVQSLSEGLAAKYQAAQVVHETSTVKLCTDKCKLAKAESVYTCECVCNGEGHADGWPPNWKKVTDYDPGLLVLSERKWDFYWVGVPVEKPKTLAEIWAERTYFDADVENETENGFSWVA